MKRLTPSKTEIKKIEDLPFVTKVTLQEKKMQPYTPIRKVLKVNFRPVVLKIDKYKVNGRYHGVRYFYLGRLYLYISLREYKELQVWSEILHPHSTSDNTAICMGANTGMDAFKRTNEYAAIVQMIWYWAHIYTTSGYRSAHTTSKVLLTKGFPMWDGKGERIKLNDPKRIESNEQPEKLYPLKTYKRNIKRFKNLQLKDLI